MTVCLTLEIEPLTLNSVPAVRMTDPFDIELIVTEIYSYLGLHDLLSCSAVCHQWNHSARKSIYERWNLRMKLTLTCNQIEVSCFQKLQWLLSHEQKIFRNLKLQFLPSTSCTEFQPLSKYLEYMQLTSTPREPPVPVQSVMDFLAKCLGNINPGITTLTLSIITLLNHTGEQCAPTSSLVYIVKTICEKLHADQVDTLILDTCSEKYAPFFCETGKNDDSLRFKNLTKFCTKTLFLRGYHLKPATIFMQNLLLSSENLKEIWGPRQSYVLQVHKVNLIKYICQSEENELAFFETLVNLKPELKALDFTVRSNAVDSIPQITKCVNDIFASSFFSLVALKADIFVLYQLAMGNNKNVQLSNVHYLCVRVRLRSENENAAFKAYPLAQIFPKVKAVIVDDFYRICRKFNTIVPTLTAENVSVCDSVQHLVITYYSRLESDCAYWETIALKFPSASTVLVNRHWNSLLHDQDFTQFVRMWLNWMSYGNADISEQNPLPLADLDKELRGEFNYEERKSKELRGLGVEWTNMFYPSKYYTLIQYRSVPLEARNPTDQGIVFGATRWELRSFNVSQAEAIPPRRTLPHNVYFYLTIFLMIPIILGVLYYQILA